MKRCPWCENSGQDYIDYHDNEWGVPSFDDQKQFEFLVLESAQAGLSWLTILRKREAYSRAYAAFDPGQVARFGEEELNSLLENPGIVRNRKKIQASLSNARAFLSIQKEWGSFSRYLWHFNDFQPLINRWPHAGEVPAKTPLSEEISRDMKKRGFGFMGPVIIYSHIQAVGLVNDHLISCFRFQELLRLYKTDEFRHRLKTLKQG
ncbi:MAG TPA: DNA-3-methyladenine glycosylase I [Firmicutes bacterium]|nr:DNA-3-methyladenine glycosylase I [Bacillota bacterium]